MPELFRLDGRRLLVIGGGQQTYGQADAPVGIGRAIAQLSARAGAHVVVADIDGAAAVSTVAAILDDGYRAWALTADACRADDTDRMIAEAARILGGLDAMAINTGVSAGVGLAGTTADDWDRVLAVNVRAHFLALRAVLGVIEPGGAITLTSSTACRAVTTTSSTAYATSKAALEALCTHTAREFAQRSVRVNIVMPGLIDTSLGRLASAVFPERDRIPIPLGRQGSPWDVAHAVVFLLSDAAAYITSTTLPVDGGLSSIH